MNIWSEFVLLQNKTALPAAYLFYVQNINNHWMLQKTNLSSLCIVLIFFKIKFITVDIICTGLKIISHRESIMCKVLPLGNDIWLKNNTYWTMFHYWCKVKVIHFHNSFDCFILLVCGIDLFKPQLLILIKKLMQFSNCTCSKLTNPILTIPFFEIVSKC